MTTRSSARPTAARLGGVAAALLAASLAAALVVSCGGSDDGTAGPAAGGDAPSEVDAVFTATNTLTWAESSVAAPAGDVTIQLRNDSTVQHNLYVVGPDGVEQPTFLDSKRLGDNPVRTMDLAAGTYRIICKIPGHTNMQADLVVS